MAPVEALEGDPVHLPAGHSPLSAKEGDRIAPLGQAGLEGVEYSAPPAFRADPGACRLGHVTRAMFAGAPTTPPQRTACRSRRLRLAAVRNARLARTSSKLQAPLPVRETLRRGLRRRRPQVGLGMDSKACARPRP